MGSKVWVSFSWITFQLLREETAKFYCTASSFHKIFNLVHDEVHDEVNLCTSKSCKVHKILRRTTFSWTCFEEYGLLRRTTFSSPTVTFFFCCLVTFGANFQLSWPDKNLRGRRGSGGGGGGARPTWFILIAFNACRNYLTAPPPFVVIVSIYRVCV